VRNLEQHLSSDQADIAAQPRIIDLENGVGVEDDGRSVLERSRRALADAVVEMNRYSTTKIVLDDPAAENVRITGAFRVGQSYLFAQTVGEAFPLNVEQSGDTIRLRSRG